MASHLKPPPVREDDSASAESEPVLHNVWTLLVVSHDACRGGAQLVLLNVLVWLKAHTSIRLKVLCLEGGEFLPRFQKIADTILLGDLHETASSSGEADITKRLLSFCGGKPDLIYGNSVAAGRVYGALASLRAPILTYVHELESSIARYAPEWMPDLLQHSSHYVGCSEAVRDNLVKNHRIAPAQVSVVHASIGCDPDVKPITNDARTTLRVHLGLETDKHVIVGCGLGMPFRKGADLFIEVGRHLQRLGRNDVHLYWIGEFDNQERDRERGVWGDHLAALQSSRTRNVTFLGLKDSPRPYLLAADVFLLPSREDPFPLVALEAAECGLPIVCFDEAGGMPTFVRPDAGYVVPFGDVESMSRCVIALIGDDAYRRGLGARAREKLLSGFTVDRTTPRLLSRFRSVAARKPTVSVIVPNYNHGRFLGGRLDSIFGQTYQDFEVIILDDASSDNSLDVVERYRDRADVRTVTNRRNSGSPFKQWLHGIDLARADILWIAESDDMCDAEFLATLLPAFQNPAVKVAYANSLVIDEHDTVIGDYSHVDYLTALSSTKWTTSYEVDAEQEINDGLGVKNTILSASAVLFRRFDLEPAMRRTLAKMRLAGDWYFHIHAIEGGVIHYTPQPLSTHRRHSESVIGKLLTERRVEEFFKEFYVTQRVIFSKYRLRGEFIVQWEGYLRDQWRAFFPDRPFNDIKECYPLARARRHIATSSSASLEKA